MFVKRAFKFIAVFVFAISIISCGEYNKVLKSQNNAYKLEMAEKYYKKEQYYKALPLFEELKSVYRGTDKAEKVYFYYAYSNYGMRDYYLAAHYFKTFVKTYPNSTYSEECSYMNAYCTYLNSPKSSLDQTSSTEAIKQLQLFMDRYPTSSKKDTCNLLIDELRDKLDMKLFEQGKLYYHTEDYRSAIVAFKTVLKEFPNSDFKEEILFLSLKSSHKLAINSIEKKKSDRLKETIEAYNLFVDNYSKSRYLKEAENIFEVTRNKLEKL